MSTFSFACSATSELYPLSLHDALPIWLVPNVGTASLPKAKPLVVVLSYTGMAGGNRTTSMSGKPFRPCRRVRSEEHTSELQSRRDLVCRLLLEKKKNIHGSSRQTDQDD